VVLTKTDGDARGGVALSVRAVTGLPIKLVGTGEKIDALEPFVPARFATRILGMGDVVGLVEQVQARVDREEMERVASKVKQGRELSLADFRDQLRQVLSMGGLDQVLDKLPGMKPEALAQANAQFDPRLIRRQIGIIDSMTPRERRFPAIIDGSRKRRIAAGAGLPIHEVSRLLKQHRQLAKTMKRFMKGGGMAKMLGALKRGGPPPLGRR
jgi:signal recognition particle subunit SRP54